jgi:hypothetical protein
MEVLEPNKCSGWQWMTWEALRAEFAGAGTERPSGIGIPDQKLFLPLQNLLLARPKVNVVELYSGGMAGPGK